MIALYARVSTDVQVEAGLVSQLAELRRFAQEKYAGEVLVEFVDDGYTGAMLDRPKLAELRAKVRDGVVRTVLAYDPDRLSRDAADLLFLLKEFEQAGARLDFSRGGFEQSDSGRLLLQMRGVFAEYERKQIRTRTQRGRLESARRGRIYGGRHPFGYTYADSALHIEEGEAATVRRIFDLLISGKSVREICRILNSEGVMPQRGARWRTSSLHRIVRNSTYAGVAAYNRRRVSAAGKVEFKNQAEWISIAVPQIIDQSTFDRAQQQLQRNARVLSGRNDKRVYILRGLLRCGTCGRRMSGEMEHRLCVTYRCTGRDSLTSRAGQKCNERVNGAHIEQAVIQSVKQILSGGILEQKLSERGTEIQSVDYGVELAKAAREIETWRRAEERAARFLVAPEHAERQHIFEAELHRSTSQRKLAEDRRAALEAARNAADAMASQRDAVRAACRKIAKNLSRLNREQWRDFLRIVLDEITVTGRRIELRGILPAADFSSIPSTSLKRCALPRRRLQAPVSRSPARGHP